MCLPNATNLKCIVWNEYLLFKIIVEIYRALIFQNINLSMNWLKAYNMTLKYFENLTIENQSNYFCCWVIQNNCSIFQRLWLSHTPCQWIDLVETINYTGESLIKKNQKQRKIGKLITVNMI